jgi:AraC-like DNA-binding protein
MSLKEGSFFAENTPSALSKSMFYYLQSCGYFNCSPDYFTDRKHYDTILLVYTLNGRGLLKYKGREYFVEKGHLFIIDCMEHQYYSCCDGYPWEFKYIHFNGSESRKYVERLVEMDSVVLPIKSDSSILPNMDKLISMALEKTEDIDIKASCLLVEILTELLLTSSNPLLESSEPEYLRRIIDVIEDKYSLKLNLEELSREACVNKYYLTRQFKKYTGQSLYEYIVNFRINKAKEFLKSTSLPVCQIAEKVGFESTSHFVKTFKQNENTTPLKFRRFWV